MPTPKSPSPSGETPAPAAAVTVPWERVERFVSQFTHDIRNGLNALELQLTFLSEISTDPEAVAEIKQLRSTLGEVNRQLQAVKIKTGSVSVHAMDYPAGDFFEDLRERFERLHAASAPRIHWDIAVDGAVLAIDPELSINALLEILGNGLHFGTESGEIEFVAKSAPWQTATQVTLRQTLPEPPGVPPESWGRQPLLSTKRNAYGLGMFRARRILEAQGASIEAACTPENVLTMTILLPSLGSANGT